MNNRVIEHWEQIPGTTHGRPASPVGDLNSEEKGTGARFNSGKTAYDLVPIAVMAETTLLVRPDSGAAKALFLVGRFQATHDKSWLYQAMLELGLEGWEECAQVFAYGKIKYAAWNWAKGMSWSVPLACAVRHLLAMIEYGEDNRDPESMLPHRGHVFCNLCMLIAYVKTYPEGNDLPPVGRLT